MGNSQRVAIFVVITIFSISIFGAAILFLAGEDTEEQQRETAQEIAQQADELAEAQAEQQRAQLAQISCPTGQVADLAEPDIQLPDYEITSDPITELETIDLVEGDGVEAGEDACIVAQYHGTLNDGTVFDGTYETGGVPIRFPLAGVIAGWQQGIPGMKEGGVRVINIPSDLAYGEQGTPNIAPNSDLIFLVKLVDVVEN